MRQWQWWRLLSFVTDNDDIDRIEPLYTYTNISEWIIIIDNV